jgi:hypothetical protein
LRGRRHWPRFGRSRCFDWEERNFPARRHRRARLGFPGGQWIPGANWRIVFLRCYQPQQFDGLRAYRGARHSLGRRFTGFFAGATALQQKRWKIAALSLMTAWYWHFMALVWLYILRF